MDKSKQQKLQPQLLPGYEERREEFTRLGWWVSIPISLVASHWLYEGEQRLDGGYYAQKVVAAKQVVRDCGYEAKPLHEVVSDLFILGRFKRIYATNVKSGWPYLSASDALDFRPDSDKYIAQDHAPQKPKDHFVKQGWLLVSSSGSVGRVLLTTKRLERFFLTHDLIRIVPSIQYPIGYIYAFLSTWIGQALIAKDQYGSAIKHLEPHQIADVSIPLLSQHEQLLIHSQISQAYELRDEANRLLDEADQLLHERLGLKRFDLVDVPYLDFVDTPNQTVNMPHPKAFSIQTNDLINRFDASFHAPTAKIAIEILNHAQYPPIQLGRLVKDIFIPNRFKRVYVQKEYGIPFLQGSHLSQNIPYDLKYISKKANEKDIEQCMVRMGYILLTRSGTIGKIGLVSSLRDKWGASEHLLRIIADWNIAHPGYIALFLMTPYGQHQIKSKVYGGVVDEITDTDTKEVWIPNAPIEVQREIGELVLAAFEKKDMASDIEQKTIKQLEIELTRQQLGLQVSFISDNQTGDSS
ncbi:MAG: restriction endonuclease subunit S [Chloroflexi bacterium]|nr:restriction endonuclease subunit S [Chloroflexota bacterium]